eukprot:14971084-Alexandrium_andersonii.AAC.1
MSASLVGSEMCIRDSPRAQPRQRPQARAARWRARPPEGGSHGGGGRDNQRKGTKTREQE